MLTSADQPHRSCPVCHRDNATHLYTNAMSYIGGLDMSYQVSRCAVCSFIYASKLPDSSVYDAYYQRLSKYDVMTSTAEIRPVDKVRMAAAVGLCAPHLAADALIADIGCGTGALLNAFGKAGWLRLYGIDPAPAAQTKANSLFDLQNVRTGTLSQACNSLPLDQAALVCLTGVLEHLPNLHRDLSSLVACINKNTMILVEVPALERFIREPLEPYGEFSLEHIQYFSTQSLGRLMAKLGYAYRAHDIVTLSEGVTDSLFGLFVRQDVQHTETQSDSADPRGYIELSEKGMQQVLDRIANCPARQLVIYGAGSHSARLLPRLEVAGIAKRIVGIVDSNPNLRGQTIGRYEVNSPADMLHCWPEATILISSFSAQEAIADFISREFPNPILRLYS